MNIILLGFMGCGKSSLGRRLSNKLNYKFIDLDKEIEAEQKKSIPEIFRQIGEERFRELETSWLEKFEGDNTIISLGGGTPCFNENMSLINKIGCSVYLKLNIGSLTHRLKDSKNPRPLIEQFRDDIEGLEKFITLKLEERSPYYEKANIKFDAQDVSAEKLDRLIEMINLMCGD